MYVTTIAGLQKYRMLIALLRLTLIDSIVLGLLSIILVVKWVRVECQIIELPTGGLRFIHTIA